MMLFGDDPLTNLVCSGVGLVGIPIGVLYLLYRAWVWLLPKALDDARAFYRYVTGPDEEAR